MPGGGQAGICGLSIGVAWRYCTQMRLLRAFSLLCLSLIGAFTVFASDARAQDRETPFWASMRFDEVNMRVGPSAEYRIDWVYRRKGMPVKVVRVREGWWLVQDHEGTQGWISASQLSVRNPGALIIGDGLAELRARASTQSPVRWRAEPGVIAELRECREGYCEIAVAGRSGWVAEERLWGADEITP